MYHPIVKSANFNAYFSFGTPVSEEEDTIGDLFSALDPANHGEILPNDPRFGDQWSLRNTGQSGGTIQGQRIKILNRGFERKQRIFNTEKTEKTEKTQSTQSTFFIYSNNSFSVHSQKTLC